VKNNFVNRWSAQVKKGILSFIVLNILKNNRFYGYELIERIKEFTEIEVAEGTLYPLLIRLKNEGLVDAEWVEQESGIPRKYYHLTRNGEETLIAMREYWVNMDGNIQKLMIK